MSQAFKLLFHNVYWGGAVLYVERTNGLICESLQAMAIQAVVAVKAPAMAAPSCYGASCNGLDPNGRCTNDAKTVASTAVKDGMLELRYSDSCKANWGHYTMYWRTALTFVRVNSGMHARVTAWNPGEPSVGTAQVLILTMYYFWELF